MNKYQTRRFFFFSSSWLITQLSSFFSFLIQTSGTIILHRISSFFNPGRFEVEMLLIWFSLFCIFRSSILGKKYQRKMLLSCRKPPSKSSRHRKRSTSRFPTKMSILRPKNQSLSRKSPKRKQQRKWTMKLNWSTKCPNCRSRKTSHSKIVKS